MTFHRCKEYEEREDGQICSRRNRCGWNSRGCMFFRIRENRIVRQVNLAGLANLTLLCWPDFRGFAGEV